VVRARAAGLPTAAIVLDFDPKLVRSQNAGRQRIVGRDVVDRHLAGVRQSVDGGGLADEGFDQVVILRSPAEAAALTIERTSA
jgi:predicted kinase